MTLLVSIVEKENILKSWPRDRLIQELAQPSGNFPPYLVASRIKDVEAMQKAAEAEAAEKRGSQQAGSVYERMITGQPEPSPQGSFAQNRPMSPGVPNVPSQIAAQPVPQPPQQPTQIPMAVAARGGYAGNLPTVRAAEGYSYPGASIGSLTTNRDVPRLTYEVWKRLAKARREGGDSRLYGAGRANYEKGAAPVVDPAFGGILSQMARVERNRAHGGFDTLPYSMTAAHGGPVGGLPVSPSRGGFVKRYANDGGYVNNLPTVRMQGEGLLEEESYPRAYTGLHRQRDSWPGTDDPRGPDLAVEYSGKGSIYQPPTLSLAGAADQYTTQIAPPKAADYWPGTEPGPADAARAVTTAPLSLAGAADQYTTQIAPVIVQPVLPEDAGSGEVATARPPVSRVDAGPLPPPVTVPPVPRKLPARIVVSEGNGGSAVPWEDLLDRLTENSANQTTRLNFLNNIQDSRSSEQISDGAKQLVTDLKLPVTTLINNSRETIEGMEVRAKASMDRIEAVMADAKKFAKGGKLPEKLQNRYINELLMTAGAAFLRHSTLPLAVAAILEGAIKVKDKYREDYAKSINTLLVNTTALETMRTDLTNATDTARISLAQSAYEFNTGAVAAGQEYEKTAYAANAERVKIENATIIADAQSMLALAQVYAAVNGKPDADERQLKDMMQTMFEELLSGGDTAAMDKWFYPVNGEYSASQYRTDIWLNKIILPMDAAGAPNIGAQSYARTNRDRYDEAVGLAQKAHGIITSGSFRGAEDARVIVRGMGLNPDDYDALKNLDEGAFIRAYLQLKNPQQIQNDWRVYYETQFGPGASVEGWEAKLEEEPPK